MRNIEHLLRAALLRRVMRNATNIDIDNTDIDTRESVERCCRRFAAAPSPPLPLPPLMPPRR